jgi:hypothetical protein
VTIVVQKGKVLSRVLDAERCGIAITHVRKRRGSSTRRSAISDTRPGWAGDGAKTKPTASDISQ